MRSSLTDTKPSRYQPSCHSAKREPRPKVRDQQNWVPACAGMTKVPPVALGYGFSFIRGGSTTAGVCVTHNDTDLSATGEPQHPGQPRACALVRLTADRFGTPVALEAPQDRGERGIKAAFRCNAISDAG
jgi:hypothetical protein